MSVATNNNKIDNVFARAIAKVQENLRIGMEMLLEDGVKYCLEAHDEKHQRHIEMGDSYGWALLYNGNEVSRKIYSGSGSVRAEASHALDIVLPTLPNQGWCGIILASMKPATYFAVTKEFRYMREGRGRLTSENFDKYFNAI